MIIKDITSKEAEKILCHPEIYKVISDDGSDCIESVKLPVEPQYVGGFVGDELIAVMLYHDFRDGVKCHIQVLPEKRKVYAEEFAGLSLELKKGIFIYADIPELYPNVLSFAEYFGFEIIENIKNSGIKNNRPYDSNLLRLEKWVS